MPRLIGLAAAAGLLGAAGAAAFTIVEHQLQHLLWTSLPEAMGDTQPQGWLVVVLLLVGALLVRAAMTLPGHGGHSPLGGLALDGDGSGVASTLLAALASLSFGAVLGPEAPLLAIGIAVAVWFARRDDPTTRQILLFAGAAAGMGTIFGNPLITGVILLEALLLSGRVNGQRAAMIMLLPVLVALGAGYLLDVGIGSWGGLAGSELSVGSLPAYDSVAVVDALVAIPLAVGVAVLVLVSHKVAQAYDRLARVRPTLGLLGAGLTVAAAALILRGLTGQPVEMVLFSGQAQIPDLITLTGVGTLGWILLAKAAAYAASLGGGFRGGQIFPAVFLGVGAAVLTSQLIGSTNLSAMVAAGIAAGGAATLRMPFSSVLLAVLLCSSAGGAITVPAIIGAVVGLMVLLAARADPTDAGVSPPAAEQEPAGHAG